MFAAAGLAAYPAAQDIRLQPLALALAAIGVVVLVLGLLARWPAAIGFALVSLGGTYAVLFEAEGARLDRLAPAYAAALLLVAELAFWSIESRVPAWSDPELVIWRLARLALACAGAAVLGAVVDRRRFGGERRRRAAPGDARCRRCDRGGRPRRRAPATKRIRVRSRLVRYGL